MSGSATSSGSAQASTGRPAESAATKAASVARAMTGVSGDPLLVEGQQQIGPVSGDHAGDLAG
ncbi:MAG TPA: hypothetical protein VKY15_03475 [Acidimicrobiales bacterium]|nr:hypothetical protein [Acidimicrobiales bacterium]